MIEPILDRLTPMTAIASETLILIIMVMFERVTNYAIVEPLMTQDTYMKLEDDKVVATHSRPISP